MPRARRTFNREMKKQICDLLNSGKKSPEQLEKEYDVSRYLIARWNKEFVGKSNGHAESHAAISGFGNAPRNQNLFELQNIIIELMQENRQLKRALYGDNGHPSPISHPARRADDLLK